MRTISIVNQKGGCGKTTTTVSLAGALAGDGFAVLVIDMDPQAHASMALGVDPEEIEENLYEVLVEPDASGRLDGVVVNASRGIDLAPGGIVLSALEQRLAAENQEARTERLAAALGSLRSQYDFALIDCPPAVGLLTFNALRASQEVIVPLETSSFAIDGVQKLLETLALLMERVGHTLSVRVLPSLYDGRTRYARETLGEIRELFKELCFDSVVRLNVKLREAAREGMPISLWAPDSNGAADYASVAMEVAMGPPAEIEAGSDTETEAAREVVIEYRDSQANDVRIAGDFNGWVPDRNVLSRVEASGRTRVWVKVLKLPPGVYQYRYFVDGQWRVDPENEESSPGPMGQTNSVLYVR
ncbi:MAG: AAA family ATPase [Myxococcota bacterium]|jgi:chromosome partitioning protein|nr:AAA family ATPase [Myxococcota bacterium]